MNPEEEKGQDYSEYARTRSVPPPPPPPPPREDPSENVAWRFVRGCLMVLGVGFLVLMFGVGACFLSIR